MDIFQNSILIIIVGVVVIIIVIVMAVYFYQKTRILEEEVLGLTLKSETTGSNENHDLGNIKNQLIGYGRQQAAQYQINMDLSQRLEHQQNFIDAILKELRESGLDISLPALPSYNKYPPKHDNYVIYPNQPSTVPSPQPYPPQSYLPQSYPPQPHYPAYPHYPQAPGRVQEQVEVIPNRRRKNDNNDDLGI